MDYSPAELEAIKDHAEKRIADLSRFLATDTIYSKSIHDRKRFELGFHRDVVGAVLGCMDELDCYQDELADLIGFESAYYEALKPVRAALALHVAA